MLDDFEIMDDTYYKKDRETQMNDKYAQISSLIEDQYSSHGNGINFKFGLGDDKIKHSEYLYLKAKAMSFISSTQTEAKEGYEKAIELHPENFEAIRDLGVAYFKLKDFSKAVELYSKSLELNENIKWLGYLSIAVRKLETKSEEVRLENINRGIEYARKAVNLELSNSHSWYLLGNAYMMSFFATEKYDDLDKSLKAYLQSEKSQKYLNPDLYFNRATIFTYFERYSEAIRDYMKAHSIDPTMGAADKATSIWDFVMSTTRLIDQKNKLKNKNIHELVKTIPKKLGEVKFLSMKESDQTLKYKILPQSDMSAGENYGVIYCGKVICHISKSPDVPACILCIDSKSTYTVISLYNITKGVKDKLKYGDEVLIRDPVLMFVSIEYESRLVTYPCIRVINLSDILINEQTLADVYGKTEVVSDS